MGSDRDDEERAAPPPRPFTPTYREGQRSGFEKPFEADFDDEEDEGSAEPERHRDDERR